MRQRNSATVLLLYAMVVSICLQLALNWQEVQAMSMDLLAAWSDQAVTVSSQVAVVTLAAPPNQGRHVVVLVNGTPCGTLVDGRIQLAVRDGDIVELDSYSRDAVAVTVINTGKQVILPVPGQVEHVQNSRIVFVRVLLRK